MRFVNSSINDFIEQYKESRIILYGAGAMMKCIEFSPLKILKDNISYVIDEKYNLIRECKFADKTLAVKHVSFVRDESNAVILITSSGMIYEMFARLDEMELSDSIICVAYPLMVLEDDHGLLDEIENINNDGHSLQYIPKCIHTFWFGKEIMPDSYKRCIESWHEHCTDYEIKIWTLDDYCGNSSPFFKRAIDLKAWAFASDYARLDIIYRYGGIYLDGDVEIKKNIERFLYNSAFFSFNSFNLIDLCVFGSKADNQLIREMLDLYQNLELDLPSNRQEFSRFYQPSFIMELLTKEGLILNGRLQKLSDNIFYPMELFQPLSSVFFKTFCKQEFIYAVHTSVLGWKENSLYTQRSSRIQDFIKLVTKKYGDWILKYT